MLMLMLTDSIYWFDFFSVEKIRRNNRIYNEIPAKKKRQLRLVWDTYLV